MQCPNCETENRDEAKFCDECGFPLSGPIARIGSGDPTAAPGAEPEPDEPEKRTTEEELQGVEAEGGKEAEMAESPGGDGEGVGAGDDADGGEGGEEGADDQETPVDEEPQAESADGEAGEEREPGAAEGAGWLDDRAFVPSDELDYYDRLAERGSAGATHPDEPSRSGDSAWAPDVTMKMPKIVADEPEGSRDFISSSTKKKQREWKRPAIVVACIVLAIALVAGIASVVGGGLGGKQIPDVVGMTEADARATLEGAGFTAKSLQVPSDETDGLVLLMDPVAGTRAEEGSEVVVQVATSRVIPDVEGKSYDEAATALEEAGYKNVRVERQKTDDEENVVVSVDPVAGTRVKSTAEVVLTVTEGYYVPDIAGMDFDSAVAAIEEAGLVPDVVYVDTTDYIEGTLMGTTPEAGSRVSGGDVVVISIARARGAELIALTQGLLAPGGMVTVGGYNFDIESLDAVEYLGNDTVSFTFTGRPRVVLFGETLYTSSTQVVSGTVVWSENNEVLSIG